MKTTIEPGIRKCERRDGTIKYQARYRECSVMCDTLERARELRREMFEDGRSTKTDGYEMRYDERELPRTSRTHTEVIMFPLQVDVAEDGRIFGYTSPTIAEVKHAYLLALGKRLTELNDRINERIGGAK